MKAAFGSVSAGGLGIPVLDVTQSGGGPSAFVANHCIGNAGAVRLSKFSIDVTKPAHGAGSARVWGESPLPLAQSRWQLQQATVIK